MTAEPATHGGARRTVVYGAFKAMGDLLCAAAAIKWELGQGSHVVLLVFPQLPREFLALIDFGSNRSQLEVVALPTPASLANMRVFFDRMSGLSPSHVWLSPHSPAPAASRKIPLLLWVVKRRYWKGALFGGADTEPFSRLLDVRIGIDRGLPFAEREWLGYSTFRGSPMSPPPAVTFTSPIVRARSEPPVYDLVICPGAGAQNRRWPLTHLAALVNLIPLRYRIAVVGVPDDVFAAKSHLPAGRSIDFCSGTLEQAVVTIARGRVAFTMDSGPMFFSRALGVPAVSLFGASNPANIIGYESSVSPLYVPACPYQPCGRASCTQKSVLCMEAIEPAAVADKLLQLLRSRGDRVASG